MLATDTAENKSVNEFEAASTRVIFAPGAIVWTVSISSDSSPSQPPVGSGAGGVPVIVPALVA